MDTLIESLVDNNEVERQLDYLMIFLHAYVQHHHPQNPVR